MSLQWVLRTRNTDYGVSVLPDGSGVVLDGWGVHGGVLENWSEPERECGFTTAADVTPLEYASDGQRHGAFSELLVRRGAGHNGAAWTVKSDEIQFETKGAGDRLLVPLVDETADLRLELNFATSSRHDVVRRSIRLVNEGSTDIELPRAFSAGWNLPLGQRVHVDYLAGSWAREFQRRSVDLGWGAFSIGSRQGVTGLQFSPS